MSSPIPAQPFSLSCSDVVIPCSKSKTMANETPMGMKYFQCLGIPVYWDSHPLVLLRVPQTITRMPRALAKAAFVHRQASAERASWA